MDELTEYLSNSADDGFWEQIQSEARREADREPVLASFLFAAVLGHKQLEDGLSVIVANKLHTSDPMRPLEPVTRSFMVDSFHPLARYVSFAASMSMRYERRTCRASSPPASSAELADAPQRLAGVRGLPPA